MADQVIGVVLAAGEGQRFGMPKALARDATGIPWLRRSVDALAAGGCAQTVVVLGALAEAAVHLVPAQAEVSVARDSADGLSMSVRAGLAACDRAGATAALITLADLPDLAPLAVRRVAEGAGSGSLRRAVYAGEPGHPVLIGRDHWRAVLEQVSGDAGAGSYLREMGADQIDCTDLGGGADIDRTPGLEAAG